MNAKEKKMSVKFGITAEDVALLVAAGFDTPRKVKDASYGQLPESVRGKLARWVTEPQG